MTVLYAVLALIAAVSLLALLPLYTVAATILLGMILSTIGGHP